MLPRSVCKHNAAGLRRTRLIVAAWVFILIQSLSIEKIRLMAQEQESEQNFGAECGTYSLAVAASAAGIELDELAIVNGDYVRQ